MKNLTTKLLSLDFNTADTIRKLCLVTHMNFHELMLDALYTKYKDSKLIDKLPKVIQGIKNRVDKRLARDEIKGFMRDYHFGTNYMSRIMQVAAKSYHIQQKFDLEVVNKVIALARVEYKTYDAKTKKLLKKQMELIESFKDERLLVAWYRKEKKLSEGIR